ncbi:alpha-tectorin-like [Mantella aurantiaca]
MKTIPLLLAVFAIFGHGSAQSDSPQEEIYENDDSILYPFGEEHGDKITPVEDDGCSPEEHLQQEFKFFEKSYKSLYVCNNGVISFNAKVSQFTPDAFPLPGGQSLITPFWGDVDNELGGTVYYRETQDTTVLQRITNDMSRHLPKLHYKAKWAYIVTWYDVSFHGAVVQKTNTFQAVLISDGIQFFVMMNYRKLEWTTGASSEGNPHTGRGGIPAQAGLSSGSNHFNIPGSRTDEVLKIATTSNVNHRGRWMFQVDEFKAPGGCIFEATFAREFVPFWKENTCSTKCHCCNNKVTCVDKPCPPSSTCELQGSFFTCKAK